MALRSNLTTNLFITNPRENLATADAYDAKGLTGKVITSVKDFTESNNITLQGILKTGKEIARILPSMIHSASLLKSDQLMDKLSAANSLTNLAIKGFPEGIKESAMNLYRDYGDSLMTVGSVAARLYDGDFKNLQSIGFALNQLAGEGTALFNDQDGIAALSLGVIQEATRYGIPNSFDAIAQTISNSDLLMKVANGALPIAIDSGDINLVRSIGSYIGSGNVINNLPNTLNGLARSFQYSEANFERKKEEFFDMLGSSFSSLVPDWRKTTRLDDNSENIYDASHFNGASEDFRDLYRVGTVNQKPSDSDGVDKRLVAAYERWQVNTAGSTRKYLDASYGSIMSK